MTKIKSMGRRYPAVIFVGLGLFLAAITTAWILTRQATEDQAKVFLGVPEAPRLSASGPNQVVYRIDASRSTVGYDVEEQLAGTSHRATGVTRGVAGDIALDGANPAASTIGDVVINVEQLTSDQPLRDARLRHDFLASTKNPLVTFHTTSLSGMPASIEDGKDYPVKVDGDLTVKGKAAPAHLEATARRSNGELHIKATSTVKLSTWDIGPINLIGFVSTGDDATLTFDLVAVDAANFKNDKFAPAPEAASVKTTGGPAFASAVKPVLEQHCASCHNSGGAGASVWKMDTAGDVSGVAGGVGLAVKSQYMPPWLASDVGIPVQHSLKLSDADRNTIVSWAEAGGGLDVDPSTPVKAPPETIREPQHDTELALPEPYQGSPAVPNDYRCFTLDPKVTSPAPVVGYQFVPDQTEIVHHALVYRMKAAARSKVDASDAGDAGSGWQCFGGVGGRGSSQSPSGATSESELVMGWAPGQQPAIYPEGAALTLEPGDFFVIQMHYHFGHDNPPDRSKLFLDLGDKPVDQYDRIRVTTYLAPAEIPCDATKGQSGPLCDRDAAIEQLTQQYGGGAAYIANGLHLLCRTTPEQIAVLDDKGVAKVSCDHRVGRASDIVAVLGHEHELGKSFRMTLNPGTPDEKILLDIPRWDFNWQMNYAPVDLVSLKKGDTIRVECSWDRNLVKPASQNRWITWSEGTEDEMCFSTITTRDTKK